MESNSSKPKTTQKQIWQQLKCSNFTIKICREQNNMRSLYNRKHTKRKKSPQEDFTTSFNVKAGSACQGGLETDVSPGKVRSAKEIVVLEIGFFRLKFISQSFQ